MSLDLKSLEIFIRVAALGAIGKAGAEFDLSPTATTHRIQTLEADLEAKLLNRTTRAVSLTTDGELFLAHAMKIMTDVEDARSDLLGADSHIKGELRITASASFGRRYIAPYVAEFLSTYPDVTLQLDLSDNVVDIVKQGYDLALRVGALAPSTLIARKLGDNPRLLVAAPSYLQRKGTPLVPKDLSNHNCIALGEGRRWALKGADGRVQETRIAGNYVTNYGEAVTEAALCGVGIALKSKWDILPYLSNGSLVPVLTAFAIEPEWSIWAVRPPGRMSPARVRVFTKFMQQTFQEIAT